VRGQVRSFARALGFGRAVCEELVIVASELGSNILKYGERGEIALRLVHDESGRPGIEIAARDIGRPIGCFETALRDGWSDVAPIDPLSLLTRRGIGAGLGAVARLSDRVFYKPEAVGKTIIAQRFLPAKAR
jgi:anti-sigma regulatory factor (Ser/Thr protein kinase)